MGHKLYTLEFERVDDFEKDEIDAFYGEQEF